MMSKLKGAWKTIKNVISVVALVFIGTLFCILLINAWFLGGTGSNSNSESVADGFTISAYKVILDVYENNQVEVTENITVDWYNTNHHGIYKFIPEWLEYTDKSGKTIKRKSLVENLASSSDCYLVDTVNQKKRIRLGDTYTYVKEGKKSYSISYLYDMGKDPYKGFDEFIFHAFGDYWGTQIKNASIEIRMPKDISDSEINFFADKYRKTNINSMVNYHVVGNTIIANVKDSLPLFKSLTVDIALPDKYFNGGSYNYGALSFILIGFTCFLTYLTYRSWQKYGKDFPKYSQTIEFYPPDNLNAAEVGYIYNEEYSRKQSVALIIELASKGYIKINEQGEDIEIINLYPLPRLEKKDTIVRTIKIKKLKDADDSLSRESKLMMKYLFKKIPFIKNDVVEITDSIDNFFKVKDELLNNGFVEIVNDNLLDIRRQEEEKVLQEKNYEEMKRIYETEISKLKPLSLMEKIIYERLFEDSDDIILSEHLTLYKAFAEVNAKLISEMDAKVNDSTARKKWFKSVRISILSFILFYLSYNVIEDLDPKLQICYLIGFIACIVILFFTIFMERKTEYGAKIKPQIEGFREFLLKAEKDQLEDLVTKNSEYFYDILPFTYVLGVSKKWISKFENIKIPAKDMGTFNYSSDYAFSAISSGVYTPSSSGSSSSGCGGGSSSGGGCSSCGGGGSW